MVNIISVFWAALLCWFVGMALYTVLREGPPFEPGVWDALFFWVVVGLFVGGMVVGAQTASLLLGFVMAVEIALLFAYSDYEPGLTGE